MTATLTLKKAVFYSNMMVEVGLEKGFSSMPLFGNTLTFHVAGNRTYSSRAKHICTEIFFRSRASGGGQDHHPLCEYPKQLADPGTKHLCRHHHPALVKLTNDFKF